MIAIVQLIVWVAVIVILMLVCLALSKGKILTPEFCYVACFLPQAICAFDYIEKYKIHLHFNTMCVLIGGACLFVIVSRLSVPLSRVHLTGMHITLGKRKQASAPSGTLNNAAWKLLAFAAFQVITCFFVAVYLVRAYHGAALQQAIYSYRAQFFIGYSSDVSYEVRMPLLIRLFTRFSTASGYFWGYLLAKDLAFKEKRNRFLLTSNLVLSILCDILRNGGKKGPFILIGSVVVMYFMLRQEKAGRKRRNDAKTVFYILALTVVFALSVKYLAIAVKSLGELLGRTVSRSAEDYLSLYIVTPIKNLDIYMERGSFKLSDISHSAVLTNVMSILHSLGLTGPYQTEMFYNRVNGVTIGNAYTVYYTYLMGMGYGGAILFTSFNAAVCQVLYQRVRKQRSKDELSVSLVIYSYFLVNTMTSFFSNFFIISVLATSFIWQLLTWNFLKWFMQKEISLTIHRTMPLPTANK